MVAVIASCRPQDQRALESRGGTQPIVEGIGDRQQPGELSPGQAVGRSLADEAQHQPFGQRQPALARAPLLSLLVAGSLIVSGGHDSGSDSRGRGQRPPGQDPGQVPPVIGRSVQVARRIRALVRVGRRGPERVPAGLPRRPRPLPPPWPAAGTVPMFVSPILASATEPLDLRTSAATPTVAHACAVRWNFS